MKGIFTRLVKIKEPNCRICYRKSDNDSFGTPHHVGKRGVNEVHVYSLCKICFDMDLAISEAHSEQLRFTEIGVGIDGINSYNGNRCACGCVTHTFLKRCIQCSKDHRMLTAMQQEKKFIDRLLKDLRAEIKSKQKENQNAN